jgi:hypothetical protein
VKVTQGKTDRQTQFRVGDAYRASEPWEALAPFPAMPRTLDPKLVAMLRGRLPNTAPAKE